MRIINPLKITCCIVFVCIFLFIAYNVCSTSKPLISETAGENPDINRIMDNIQTISAYKRFVGSPGEKDAGKYIKNKLASYGYEPQIQVFPYPKDLKKAAMSSSIESEDTEFWNINVPESEKGGESQNIIACKKASRMNNGHSIIILSAHYDDIGYGAVIDNATGLALLLELSKLSTNINSNTEIRFVFLSGEEVGLLGSRYYVSKLSPEEKGSIIANINLDYIGVKGENKPILVTIDGNKNNATDLFTDNQSKSLKVTKALSSDYISFGRAGIPSVSLGQLPSTFSMPNNYSSIEEANKELIQMEFSHLDEGRLRETADMLIKIIKDN